MEPGHLQVEDQNQAAAAAVVVAAAAAILASDPDDLTLVRDTSRSSTATSTTTSSANTTVSRAPTRRYSIAGVIRSLFHAVLVQDTSHLEHVLTSLSLDPNKIRDKDRRTMLMVAATENKHLVLRYLLSLPLILVDLPDDEGETALYQASAAGSTECVHLLLLAGASASMGNEESITPLIIASYNGFVTICRLVINLGQVNVNQQDNTQKSALLLASYAGHVEIMAELISHGADLDMLDQYGWSSLMLAAYAGRLEACKLLLYHGADPDIKTSNGKNARNLSWDAGHRSVAAYITKFVQSGGGGGTHMMLKPMMTPPRSPSKRTHSPAPSLPSVPEELTEDVYQRTTRHSFSGHTRTNSTNLPAKTLRRGASTSSSPPVSSTLQLEPMRSRSDLNVPTTLTSNTTANGTISSNATTLRRLTSLSFVNSQKDPQEGLHHPHHHSPQQQQQQQSPLLASLSSTPSSSPSSSPIVVASASFAALFRSAGKPSPPVELKMREFPIVSSLSAEEEEGMGMGMDQGLSSPPLSISSSLLSSLSSSSSREAGSKGRGGESIQLRPPPPLPPIGLGLGSGSGSTSGQAAPPYSRTNSGTGSGGRGGGVGVGNGCNKTSSLTSHRSSMRLSWWFCCFDSASWADLGCGCCGEPLETK